MIGVVARCIGRAGCLRLARCRAGATIVEFALVLPVIVTMLIGLIETGLILTAQGMLDAAATSAARYGTINADGSLPEATIRSHVAARAASFIDMDRLQVQARSYSNFAAIGQGQGTQGYGGPDDVVVYTLTYPWHGFTPLLGGVFSNVDLRATVAVRNEPE